MKAIQKEICVEQQPANSNSINQQAAPSRAMDPDLDWSQIRETLAMLRLAICQIESSLNDGARSIEKLSSAFTVIVNEARALHDTAGLDNETQHHVDVIEGAMAGAVTDFQFYDRINQRLDHVACGLGKMQAVIGDPTQIYNPLTWSNVQDEIKSSYSMESERLMFEKVMQGGTVEQALETLYEEVEKEKGANKPVDDIDFF